jgi:hypothetical protein
MAGPNEMFGTNRPSIISMNPIGAGQIDGADFLA